MVNPEFEETSDGGYGMKIINMINGTNMELLNEIFKRAEVDYSDTVGSVKDIVNAVKEQGDQAVFDFTEKFDKVALTAETVKVTTKEFEEAYAKVEPRFIEVIQRAIKNIAQFHEQQKSNSWMDLQNEGVVLGQKVTPLETVGVYVPGGTAPYPSSVLMNVVPAKVAGVKNIIMVTPPSKDGKMNPHILIAAKEAGVTEVFKLGGAQAVAALAFGTQTVPKVDKIVGPGNIYVALAKREVYGYVDIDMIAGPSEILIIADSQAVPEYVAADLLSQAEHDTLASSILLTDSEELAQKVTVELDKQLSKLSRKEIAQASLENYGAIVITKDIQQALEISNQIAPEHLEICVQDPFDVVGEIKNAGAIFLGNYTPEPVGDYMAGPNHVLPTNGTARFFSALGVDAFVKKSSILSFSKKALQNIYEDVVYFAEAEGLTAHANAAKVRFENE